MTGSGYLRATDAEAVVRLLADARHDDPGPALPWSLLDGLRDLCPRGTDVSYQVFDGTRGRVVLAQETSEGAGHVLWEDDPAVPPDEYDVAYASLWWHDPLCSHPERTGDVRSVLLSTDFFPTDRDLRNRPLAPAVTPGIRSLMQITLPSPGGLTRRVVLATYPGGHRLGERERTLGALLRPHLEEARVDNERRRAGVPRLTPREWECLALTAAGLSHAEIADRLVVSVSTVHKHMENVRARLGVRNAVAAAAVALPHAPTLAGASVPGQRERVGERLGERVREGRRVGAGR